jgi:hypothetical protein
MSNLVSGGQYAHVPALKTKYCEEFRNACTRFSRFDVKLDEQQRRPDKGIRNRNLRIYVMSWLRSQTVIDS